MGAPKRLTDPARFFLEPVQARHRQYEALRAYFVEHRSTADVAHAFGYTPGSFRVLCHQFRNDPGRVFFVDPTHGPQEQPKKSRARRLIIEMVLDEIIRMNNDYTQPIRQICARDLGHDEPTVVLTNDLSSTAATIIERYALRMLIENSIEDQVHFFHIDALSSAVAMKVDFDLVLTVIATGLYRLLGTRLHGFEHAKARQIFRRFLDTHAKVDVSPDGVRVRLPRRAHNALLIDSGMLAEPVDVPWWGGALLKVEFP